MNLFPESLDESGESNTEADSSEVFLIYSSKFKKYL